MYALLSATRAKQRTTPRSASSAPTSRRRTRSRSRRSATGPVVDDTTRPDHPRDPHLRHAARHARRSRPASARTPTRASTGAPSSSTPACGAARSCGARRRCRARATIQARDGTRDRQGPGPPVRPRTARVRDRRHASAPRRRSAPPSSRRAASRPAPRSGLTGLEREFDERLTGTPGGVAVRRRPRARQRKARGAAAPCARRSTRRSSAPRSTRSPAATAGSRSSRPQTGEVLALAGIAQSAPQPPGSDVQDRDARRRAASNKVAKRNATYPVQNAATIEGVEIQNANGESCGGSLRDLLRALLQQRLRAAGRQARRARSSSRPPRSSASTRTRRLAGAARSHDPRRGRDRRRPRRRLVRDRPGQGARHAAADGARRAPRSAPTACAPRRRCSRATTRSACARPRKSVARTIKSYMRTVVTDGTGGAAALPGVKVVGQDRHRRAAHDRQGGAAAGGHRPRTQPPPEDDTTDTDAWFVAFAPYSKPSDRRRGDARRPGRGRRHRRARGRRRPQSRAASARGSRSISAALVRLALLDLELERAVLQRVGLEPEEDQRALDRAAGRRACPASGSTCAWPQRHRARRRTGSSSRPAGPGGTRSPSVSDDRELVGRRAASRPSSS